MSITDSYGHLARGLEIVSVAIPMASSFFISLKCFEFSIQAASNSSLHLWWSVRQSIETVSAPFSAPGPRQIPLVHGYAEQNGVSYPKRVPGVWERHWDLKSPLIAQVPNAGYTLAQELYVAAWYASGS